MLKDKIDHKKARICVMGMGYVGLPLAVAFADKGYFVYGFDTSESRISKLNRGENYIVDVSSRHVLKLIKDGRFLPTIEAKALRDSDVVIVCVPTPLRKVKIPDISYVVNAARTVKKYLKKGQLIILESTSYPTTTSEVVLPILKQTGLVPEKDFYLCFSPERVNPGDKDFPVTRIPKLVGGTSYESGSLALRLYSQIIARVTQVSSAEVAETAKLLENTFRMVNIALANEFSIVCHKLGISIWEVIAAAATKPFGFMPFYPGPGVGGHCLPCDPIYLSWKARKMGFKTRMIDLASSVNHYMPRYVVERVGELLSSRGNGLKGSRVLIMGVTYKKDVLDLRESPAIDIIENFKAAGTRVDYYDPLAEYLKVGSIDIKRSPISVSAIKKYDCLVIVTDHSGVDYEFLRKHSRLVFDTRNVYKKSYANVRSL